MVVFQVFFVQCFEFFDMDNIWFYVVYVDSGEYGCFLFGFGDKFGVVDGQNVQYVCSSLEYLCQNFDFFEICV